MTSKLPKRFGSMRSRPSPRGLEASWPTRSTSGLSWWMRSLAHPKDPPCVSPQNKTLGPYIFTAAVLLPSHSLSLNLPLWHSYLQLHSTFPATHVGYPD
uniref:Uncharacterized protein n=1 Tax=Oryctolagus cuniculus TaxID=9986 RepID=A0A5F9CA38_RABIT